MEHIRNEHCYDGFHERRSGRDRRQRRFPSLKGLFIYRKRRTLRRAEDRRKIVLLDYYSQSFLFIIVLIMGLSVVDALLTLLLLDHGAVELNPVMAYFLNRGPLVFMTAKYLLTTAGVLIVLILNQAFIRPLMIEARVLFRYFAGIFATVIGWEFFLFVRYVP